MAKHAAFLRGVNLAGKRTVSGAELRAVFEDLGFDEVASFRNSGNVAFAAGGGSTANLTKKIEAALAKATGFDVTVFLRTAKELRAIAGREPFDSAAVKKSKGKLQVVLLGTKPSGGARKRALALATDQDLLAVSGRELYWLPSGGTRDSAIGPKEFDDVLGETTMRTMGTIEQMAAKFFAG